MFRRNSKIALLEEVPLFRGLARKHLEQVGRLADEIEVRTGRRLVTAGERGHQLFVIVEGRAVARVGRGRTVRLGPGEFFGEMSLVDGGPCAATVEAATDMRLLVVGHREFWALLNAAPPLVAKIMATLSRRVRDAETSV
ncbi:MAG TPA: cyclic nucleotide-binding domain-containing protein [bacterium]|nr:cyclic nucleotide-binding domain-containing protein [bacterium]